MTTIRGVGAGTEKPNIVIIGSLNMDIVVSMPRLPKLGETISGEAVHYIPGGKGANQALGCGRLTAATTMIGCIGTDVFGEQIHRQMEANGVSLGAIGVIEGEMTGTAHISHTEGDNCIVVVAGANAACTAEYVARHADKIRSASVAVSQLEIPLSGVLAAFEIAKSAGVLTVLNPAPARDLPEELLHLTDYITPNETEWELISGVPDQDDSELARSMIAWEERYGMKVFVTRGDKGCSYIDEGTLMTVAPPLVKVVDTTGAGDAFNAAFAYGLAEGKPFGEIVRFAVSAASLSVQKFGAQNGMPTLEEVLRA
jgi:ribokinase